MEDKLLTKSDIRKMFIRSTMYNGSFNFERGQAMGYCYTMIPAIKRIYPPGEERNDALKRHLEWFNTHPWVTGPVFGISAAMEEEKALVGAEKMPPASISAMKIGLMGPLAGVGDPLIWGTLRPILASLGASLALAGSLLGPIIFFVGVNAVRIPMEYYGISIGYEKGSELIKEMAGNKVKKLTEGATVMGLFVMGALVSQWTNINVVLEATRITNEDGTVTVQTVQDILDSIMPGILALGLTLFVAYLLRKNVSPLLLIVIIFIVGILGYAAGILG